MATRTTTQLIAGVRQLANVQNNRFVEDSELVDRLNEAVKELYDLIVSTYEHYYVEAFSFTLAGGQTGNFQSLEELSFYKDNTLEFSPGNSNMRIVTRLGANQNRDGSAGRQYQLLGTPAALYVYPPEQSAGNYRLLYTPDAPVLSELVVIDMTTGINAVDGTLKIWTLENASFTQDNVGDTLIVRGAGNSANNGSFIITEVTGATTVKTADDAPASESLGTAVSVAVQTQDTETALDTTMNKWFEYLEIRAAIDVHRKRQKISEAMELAGSEADPRPGTLAYIRKNVLTLARNRQEQPQQVPLAKRRSSFWDWDNGN